MKNKRIVASFNKVSVPIERKEAMLDSILERVDAEYASLEKEQERNPRNTEHTAQRATKHRADNGGKRYRMPAKRRALVIVIAAVLLLLSACAAYAIYWSSTQRAKEYVQSEQARDDRRTLAERSADEMIAGMTFYGAISGTAVVDGITLELKGASYWPSDDPPEMHIAFNATDAKTGDSSRLYDFDYVLAVGGKTYPAYAKADGTARARPMITQADSMAEGAEHEIWFRIGDQVISDNTPMSLSGTLYTYDDAGNRGESLGSFALDFTYEIPTEQIEAERARLVEEGLAGIEAQAAKAQEMLSAQPDAATELNIVQGAYTLVDAAVSKDGILLGTIGEYGWHDQGANTSFTPYVDGYRWGGKGLSSISEEHTEAGKNVHGEYPRKVTALELLPWYAPVEALPETVLVTLMGEEGTDVYGIGDGVEHTFKTQEIRIAFRINPRTGEVTLPKDDAERLAWCEETLRMAADGRNEKRYVDLSGEQTINGVTLTLDRIMFYPLWGEAFLGYTIDGMYCPPEKSSTAPRIFMDGAELENMMPAGNYTEALAKQWVESYIAAYGSYETIDGWDSNTQGHTVPVHPLYLPDTFTVRLVWDIYDRDEAYQRVFVGSFDIETTVRKSDMAIGGLDD